MKFTIRIISCTPERIHVQADQQDEIPDIIEFEVVEGLRVVP